MRVLVDGLVIPAPQATNLGELFGAVTPHLDPARLVTRLAVDGEECDPTDARALSGRRFAGGESVEIVTESVVDFVRSRRASSIRELGRIADWLSLAAKGLREGKTEDANVVLAAASKELALILQLDEQLTQLGPEGSSLPAVTSVIERCGQRLNDAEQKKQWTEVAGLLDEQLIPALRLDSAAA